jgi:RNA recognition motif-containing protein
MAQQLFVHNLLPTITVDQLRDLFAEVGPVVSVQRPVDRESGQPRKFAFVTMNSLETAQAAVERFNGYQLEGQQIEVKVAEERKSKKVDKKEVQKLANEIAKLLHETAKRPQAQIRRIIEECGLDFAQQLLHDSLQIQTQGGMMTNDSSRQRTPGGTFFKLAKDRMTAELRAKIFPSWREIKQRKKAEKAARKGDDEAKVQAGGPQRGAKSQKTLSPKAASAPVTPKRSIEEARQKLSELRRTEQASQKRLTDIQAGRIRGGMLEAMREVAGIKSQIATLLKDHPELK